MSPDLKELLASRLAGALFQAGEAAFLFCLSGRPFTLVCGARLPGFRPGFVGGAFLHQHHALKPSPLFVGDQLDPRLGTFRGMFAEVFCFYLNNVDGFLAVNREVTGSFQSHSGYGETVVYQIVDAVKAAFGKV